MKKNIHPKCKKITAICSCGANIKISSILKDNISLDICFNCHPFYTGQLNNSKTKKLSNKRKKNFFFIE